MSASQHLIYAQKKELHVHHLGWHSKKPPCCSKDPPKFSSNQREISSQLFTPATDRSLPYRIQLCSDLIKMKECYVLLTGVVEVGDLSSQQTGHVL